MSWRDRVLGLITRRWWAVIAAWVVAAAAAIAFTPSFDEVATFDDSTFLPEGSPALVGQRLVEEGWPDDNFMRSATVAFLRPDRRLTEDDTAYAQDVVDWLRGADAPDAFGHITTHLDDPSLTDSLTSDNGQALVVVAGLEAHPHSPPAGRAVESLRERLGDGAPSGLETYVTGQAGIAFDENTAIDASVERTELLSVALVALLMLLIFRSPITPIVPLATVGAAYVVSLGIVAALASNGMDVSYLFETFSVIIAFGAGTDYCLLTLSRLKERLGEAMPGGWSSARMRVTLVATVSVLAGALASSAGSTMVGFSSQSVAEFGLFRTLGPALAITIATALLAGLTLAPAIMQALGTWLFWPVRPPIGAHSPAHAVALPRWRRTRPARRAGSANGQRSNDGHGSAEPLAALTHTRDGKGA